MDSLATRADWPDWPRTILTMNAGSSSIKFALFETPRLIRKAGGKVERIGTGQATLSVENFESGEKQRRPISSKAPEAAVTAISEWIGDRARHLSIAGIGHRIVHGGPDHVQPEHVSPELVEDLRRIQAFDPEHLPREIDLLEEFERRFPEVPQVACFDTAFHRELPAVAKILPLPRRFYEKGIRRYGFHGLSYAFLLEELERCAGHAAASGHIIFAHLGNGASLAAVRERKPIDTTMGLTPASGIPMSTRSGDLDPGLIWFLNQTEGIAPREWNKMVNSQAGLLGISGTSGDIRDLIGAEHRDARASEAVNVFCYGIIKTIGALTAALGGLNTLVFSGGIGENSPQIRERVCDALGHLGIELDREKNSENAALISGGASGVAVRVIHTDEEIMIARHVCEVLGFPGGTK